MNKIILVITPTSFFSHRGCHIRIYEELKSLIINGVEPTVVTYHVGDDIKGVKIKRIPNFFWYKKEESGPSWQKIYLDFFLLILSFIQALKIRPSILHCHLHEGALIGIFLKIILRKKIIFDSQGSLVDELESFGFIKKKTVKYWIFYKIEKYIYKYSDEIIVSNEKNLTVLREEFFVNIDKITLIPDGVRIEEVKKLKNNKSDLIIPNNKIILVYLGTLNQVEGVDNMLLLLSELKKKREDFYLIAMGYPNVKYYKERGKELGLENCIQWTGKVDYSNIYSYLSYGDMAISLKHPTSEGNGKLLNYAAIGLPVICYDHKSNRSILDSNGLYISHDVNLEKQVDSFNKYLNISKNERIKIGELNKARVSKIFEWENIIKNLLNIYSKYDRKN